MYLHTLCAYRQGDYQKREMVLTLLIGVSSLIAFYYINMFLHYDQVAEGFLYIRDYQTGGSFPVDCATGIDGLSVLFLLLTSLIFPLCFLLSRSIELTSGPR